MPYRKSIESLIEALEDLGVARKEAERLLRALKKVLIVKEHQKALIIYLLG